MTATPRRKNGVPEFQCTAMSRDLEDDSDWAPLSPRISSRLSVRGRGEACGFDPEVSILLALISAQRLPGQLLQRRRIGRGNAELSRRQFLASQGTRIAARDAAEDYQRL